MSKTDRPVRDDHQEEFIVETEVTRGHRPEIQHDDAAARAVAKVDAGELAQASDDPVEEWGWQSFPASDAPQNW